MHDWYWAARRNEPAGDAFVIANGKDALWHRVRTEIDAEEKVAWNDIHYGSSEPSIIHILDMLLTVIPMYRINHNRFMLEAAQIPCFAEFLKAAPATLSNYVSNSIYPDAVMPLEPYSPQIVARLGAVASQTLNVEPNWFEY